MAVDVEALRKELQAELKGESEASATYRSLLQEKKRLDARIRIACDEASLRTKRADKLRSALNALED